MVTVHAGIVHPGQTHLYGAGATTGPLQPQPSPALQLYRYIYTDWQVSDAEWKAMVAKGPYITADKLQDPVRSPPVTS